jgi:HrpA-like RNA helicase
VVLPIDAYREKIIAHIAEHSVTIIHGMTGCGKSSRLPQMLLEDGESLKKPTMIMVSQPRRIAATALKNRLQEQLGAKVGLRLGQGIKEESAETQLWFVTTGYLVRLLAHNMKSFEKYTHLVIDEVCIYIFIYFQIYM